MSNNDIISNIIVPHTGKVGGLSGEIRYIDWNAPGCTPHYTLSVAGHGMGYTRRYKTEAGARRALAREVG